MMGWFAADSSRKGTLRSVCCMPRKGVLRERCFAADMSLRHGAGRREAASAQKRASLKTAGEPMWSRENASLLTLAVRRVRAFVF